MYTCTFHKTNNKQNYSQKAAKMDMYSLRIRLKVLKGAYFAYIYYYYFHKNTKKFDYQMPLQLDSLILQS